MSIINDNSLDELAHAADAMTVAVRQMGVTVDEAIEAAHIFAVGLAKVWPMVSTKEALDAHDMLIEALGNVDNAG